MKSQNIVDVYWRCGNNWIFLLWGVQRVLGRYCVLSSVSHNELVVIGLLNNETSVIEFINSRGFMSNEQCSEWPLTPCGQMITQTWAWIISSNYDWEFRVQWGLKTIKYLCNNIRQWYQNIKDHLYLIFFLSALKHNVMFRVALDTGYSGYPHRVRHAYHLARQ